MIDGKFTIRYKTTANTTTSFRSIVNGFSFGLRKFLSFSCFFHRFKNDRFTFRFVFKNCNIVCFFRPLALFRRRSISAWSYLIAFQSFWRVPFSLFSFCFGGKNSCFLYIFYDFVPPVLVIVAYCTSLFMHLTSIYFCPLIFLPPFVFSTSNNMVSIRFFNI